LTYLSFYPDRFKIKVLLKSSSVHVCNPNSQEADSGGLWIPGWSKLNNELDSLSYVARTSPSNPSKSSVFHANGNRNRNVSFLMSHCGRYQIRVARYHNVSSPCLLVHKDYVRLQACKWEARNSNPSTTTKGKKF
jgi:hypothetical protein